MGVHEGMEKLTSEAYADDLTILFKMSNDSVGKILQMLRDFEQVNGLTINIGKKQLMVTCSDNWEIGINVIGIKVVDWVS